MTDLHTLPDRLTDARANAEKLRAALVRATAHAAATEVARCDAEAKHCALVADALVDDGKPPAKPASLSALQAADDAADLALAEIEKRLKSAEGEAIGAAHALAETSISELAQRRAIESRQALRDLIAPFENLIAALGLSGARYAATEMIGRPFKDESATDITRIAELVPEVGQIRIMADIRFPEAHVLPSPAEIAVLVDEVRK